jgi:hypothetical protein
MVSHDFSSISGLLFKPGQFLVKFDHITHNDQGGGFGIGFTNFIWQSF